MWGSISPGKAYPQINEYVKKALKIDNNWQKPILYWVPLIHFIIGTGRRQNRIIYVPFR